jgi:hypothetical protein
MANKGSARADWVPETDPPIEDRVATLEAALTTTGTAVGVVGDIVAEASSSVASAGATGRWADAAHRHAMPALQVLAAGASGDIVAETFGGTVAAGATGKYADAGHKHALAAETIPHPRVAAGVPSGAPTAGENGMAFDTTASTGGLYAWNGSAWVQGSVIP